VRSYCPSSRLPWYRSPEPSPKPGRRDRPLELDWPETLLLVPELDDMLLSPYVFLSDWMEYRADDSRSSHSSLRRLIGWSLKIGKADGLPLYYRMACSSCSLPMVGQDGDGMKRFKGSSRDDYARRRRIFAFFEVQMAFVVVGLYLGRPSCRLRLE
jgi:hypothetical protein